MIFIYALIDPNTRQIRYIGKSIRPRERLQNHMNEPVSNCHRSHWLQGLKAEGKKPHQVILQELDDADDWQAVERWWIAKGKASGWPLTNNTAGGDGVPDLPLETRQKMSQVWLGRKHKPETIEKLKIARAKRVTKDETRLKHSRAMKGRKITWIDKISEANRKFTQEDAEKIRQRLLDGEKVIDLAEEYQTHRTTITKIKHGRYFKPA